MTPSQLSAKVVAARSTWVRDMLSGIRKLPLGTLTEFRSDWRNPAAAESQLRRALEALLDLGRHVLAKGFGKPASEYKDIARYLAEVGVLDERESRTLKRLAGYRNRMVHFYDEISVNELYEICSVHLSDVESLLSVILQWIEAHPEKIDQAL